MYCDIWAIKWRYHVSTLDVTKNHVKLTHADSNMLRSTVTFHKRNIYYFKMIYIFDLFFCLQHKYNFGTEKKNTLINKTQVYFQFDNYTTVGIQWYTSAAWLITQKHSHEKLSLV